MPCFHIRTMYPTARGGRWTCDPAEAAEGAAGVPVGCGYCKGCLLRRSGEWLQRCVWELADPRHDGVACFVTLTFSDEHLPSDYSVSVEDMQRFTRALRQAVRRQRRKLGLRHKGTVGIRFYAVGEYGEKEDATKRPHYHFILFGWAPDDQVPAEKSKTGLEQWSSEFLDRVWAKGRVRIGEVTPQSIGYVTGYVFDKRWGEAGKAEYSNRVHAVSGEVCSVRPPFNHMSRMPGIGGGWFEQMRDTADVWSGFVVRNDVRLAKDDGLSGPSDPFRPQVLSFKTRKVGMPRYITRQLLKGMSPDEQEAFKATRRAEAAERAAKVAHDNTAPRLAIREAVALQRGVSLSRSGGSEVELLARVNRLCEEAGRLAQAERDGSAQAQRDLEAQLLKERVRVRRRDRRAAAESELPRLEKAARRRHVAKETADVPHS